MASGYSLKDALFNRDKIRYLAGLFAAADDRFASREFERAVMEQLTQQRRMVILETLY